MGCLKKSESDDAGSNNDEDKENFDFNKALESIGHFGRFHWVQLALLFSICVCCGISSISFIFTGFVPKYRCLIPQCESIDNATYFGNAQSGQENGFDDYVNLGTEVGESGFNQHKCLRRKVAGSSGDGGDFNCQSYVKQLAGGLSRPEFESCDSSQVVYDNSVVHSSYVTRFNFTCQNFQLRGYFNSLVLAGMLVSSLPVGIISDRFGRKFALGICVVVNAVAGVVNAFSTNLFLFGLCRLLIGMAHIGAYISSYVLLIESTLPKFTNNAGAILSLAWPSGNMVLVLFAYFIRDLQWLQLGLFGPFFLHLIPLAFVKESTRWLLSKGRFEEARRNVTYMAKMNGRRVPVLKAQLEDNADEGATKKKGNISDLFKHKKILPRTVIWFYQWFCTAACTYGLIYASTGLVGNPYLNFFIVAVVGFPARIIGLYLFDRLGRRKSLILLQAIAGGCTVAVAQLLKYEHLGTLQVLLTTLAKFCSSMAFNLIYIFVAEMYPTNLRSTAIGACSSVSRLGGIFALSIDFVKEYWTPLPLTLYGSLTLGAALLATKFPETAGNKLPETVSEAADCDGKTFKLKPWCRRNSAS